MASETEAVLVPLAYLGSFLLLLIHYAHKKYQTHTSMSMNAESQHACNFPSPEEAAFYGYELVTLVTAGNDVLSLANRHVSRRERATRRNGFYHSQLLQSAVMTSIDTKEECGNTTSYDRTDVASKISAASKDDNITPDGHTKDNAQPHVIPSDEKTAKRSLSVDQEAFWIHESDARPSQRTRRVSMTPSP